MILLTGGYMDIIKDMDNLKIYSERIDKYDVFYTIL